MPPHRIRALLETTGKTAVGFEVPEETVLALGKGKRPPVRVTATRTGAPSRRWVGATSSA